MIRHIVLTTFKAETSEETIAELYSELTTFARELGGALERIGKMPVCRLKPDLLCVYRTQIIHSA